MVASTMESDTKAKGIYKKTGVVTMMVNNRKRQRRRPTFF